MAHYDIFRHNLVTKYPAYGHALWEPSPGDSYPAVEVGDVGFIREGRFHRLFNVLLPAEDLSHENFGVPEYHEQLTLPMKKHITSSTLSPNNFCSARVTLESASGVMATGPDSPAEVSFSCGGKQGAVLSLPVQAVCKNTLALGEFGKWIIKHIDSWFAWARRLGLGIGRMEDIILVTGTHRTRSWTNVAFPRGQEDGQVSFGANVASRGDVVTINWNFSHERNRGAVLNCGPNGELQKLLEDQCIFIRGYRVTRKFVILPRGLKAAAGPNPDPKGHDCEPDVELTSISVVPEYRDPLHILLEYIAEEAPHCDMALVHDDDLTLLVDGLGDDASQEVLQPDTVLRHVRCLKPKVHDATFGPDRSSRNNSANADAETLRVATLSTIFGGGSPLPVSLAFQNLDYIGRSPHTVGGYLPQSHSRATATPATEIKMTGQRPSTQGGRGDWLLDNARKLARAIGALVGSSDLEGRGDWQLDNARELTRENETAISPGDLEIVRERIILAAEIKSGLESKRGLSRYLQARRYCKAAKETLKFVEMVSDRAGDATLQQSSESSAATMLSHDTVSGRRPMVLVPLLDAVPLQAKVPNTVLIDSEGSTEVRKRLRAEMKPKFATLVESMYFFRTSQFHSSISYNARRAQELLRDMNFIYPEPRTGRDPYRHPIIQLAINTTWFRDKDDIGVVDHEHFSPMPISIIALTLTMIECCIDEWSDGMRRDSNWDDEKFQTVYDLHVSSLQAHGHTNNGDLLYQLQCDLLRKAREYAGVPPNPVTALSRFPLGALDAVREEDNPTSSTDPPNYDGIPRITVDHV